MTPLSRHPVYTREPQILTGWIDQAKIASTSMLGYEKADPYACAAVISTVLTLYSEHRYFCNQDADQLDVSTVIIKPDDPGLLGKIANAALLLKPTHEEITAALQFLATAQTSVLAGETREDGALRHFAMLPNQHRCLVYLAAHQLLRDIITDWTVAERAALRLLITRAHHPEHLATILYIALIAGRLADGQTPANDDPLWYQLLTEHLTDEETTIIALCLRVIAAPLIPGSSPDHPGLTLCDEDCSLKDTAEQAIALLVARQAAGSPQMHDLIEGAFAAAQADGEGEHLVVSALCWLAEETRRHLTIPNN